MDYVLVLITVTGLVIVLVTQSILHYKERIFMIKMSKSKDLPESEYMFGSSQPAEETEEELVELSQMPDLSKPNLEELK